MTFFQPRNNDDDALSLILTTTVRSKTGKEINIGKVVREENDEDNKFDCFTLRFVTCAFFNIFVSQNHNVLYQSYGNLEN